MSVYMLLYIRCTKIVQNFCMAPPEQVACALAREPTALYYGPGLTDATQKSIISVCVCMRVCTPLNVILVLPPACLICFSDSPPPPELASTHLNTTAPRTHKLSLLSKRKSLCLSNDVRGRIFVNMSAGIDDVSL
jgi:hypothetical protein